MPISVRLNPATPKRRRHPEQNKCHTVTANSTGRIVNLPRVQEWSNDNGRPWGLLLVRNRVNMFLEWGTAQGGTAC